MKDKELLSNIEWEILLEPIQIKDISNSKYIKPHPEIIQITRDEDYNLILNMSGKSARLYDVPPDRNLKLGQSYRGEFIEGWVVKDYPLSGKVEISSAFQSGYLIQSNGNFESKGYTNSIRILPQAYLSESSENYVAKPVVKVIEYCVSGPEVEITSSVGVRTNYSASIDIKWEIEDSEKPDFWNYNSGSGHEGGSRSGLFFKTNMGEFLISNRAGDFFKKKHSPISIHYLDAARAQSKNYREKILNIVSIIFGRSIFSVGVSFFDENHSLLEATSYTFYSANLKKELTTVSWPSWYLVGISYESGYSENVACQLFDLLSDAYEKYNLKDVFIDYWIARAYPLGVDLVWYASALEGLVNKWFSQNKSQYPSSYVCSKEFNDLLKDVIQRVDSKAKGEIQWNKVKNSLLSSNSLGSRDKQLHFFKLHGLNISDVEIKAMQSRNKYAHGGNYSNSDFFKVKALSRAYMTLFHRALLAVIGYNGKYVDYSAEGFPLKDLSEALGGPDNDHRPFGDGSFHVK